MRENIVKRMPLLLITCLLTMSICDVYLRLIEIELTLPGLLLFGVLSVALVELVMTNKWTLLISGGALVLHLLFSLVNVPVFHNIAVFINQCLLDTYEKIFWTDRQLMVSEFGTVFIVFFLVCLSVHVLYTKSYSVPLTGFMLLIYIFFMELFEVGDFAQVMRNLLLTVLALLALYAYKWYNDANTEQKKKLSLRRGIPFLCGILALTVAISFAIDMEPNLDFQRWIEKEVQNFSFGDDWGLNLPQYKQSVFEKNNGTLGGDVSLDTTPLFQVMVYSENGEALTERSVYLRGAACDYFEDNAWLMEIDNGGNKKLEDYLEENTYFCSDGDNYTIERALRDATGLYEARRFIVVYGENASETLFNHTQTTGIVTLDTQGETVYYDNSTYTYQKGNTDWYEVSYLEMNRNSEALNTYMDKSVYATYKDGNLSNSFKKQVEKYYLQVPKDMPESVKAMAQWLTGDYDNDYDRAVAIESYLKNNYTYTLTPGEIPEGRNLVEYFLFENRQGYCVYYASAMVMLCRSIGIPARYVRGYRADGVRNGDSLWVKESNAHAWVEVLLPQVGWVTFDPVSANSFQQNDPEFRPPLENSPTKAPTSPTPTATPTATATPTVPPTATVTPTVTPTASMDTPSSGTPMAETPTLTPTATPSTIPTVTVPPTQTPTASMGTPPQIPTVTPASEPQKTNAAIWWILCGLGILLLAGALLLLWMRHRQPPKPTDTATQRLQKASVRIYNQFVCVYTFLGQAPETGETVAQYLARLGNPELIAMTSVLENCFYNQAVLTKEQHKILIRLLRQQERIAVEQKGKIKWKRFQRNFHGKKS